MKQGGFTQPHFLRDKRSIFSLFKYDVNFLRKSGAGFTLVELIITITIVSLIAVAVFIASNPAKRIGETQDSRRWSDLTSVATAVEFYTADFGQLPSDFSTTTVGVSDKVVLCSSEATLTCDGQTKGCLVVDDTDFLGVYLNDLPVDPSKTADTDTGYYLTRASSGALSFGACADYQSDGMEFLSKVPLPTYSVSCGDGLAQGDEVCDDGNLVTESCGDGTQQAGSDYCNSTCSATYAGGEVCDDDNLVTEVCGNGIKENGTFCNSACTVETVLSESCDYYEWVGGCYDFLYNEITNITPGSGDYCDIACTSRSFICGPPS